MDSIANVGVLVGTFLTSFVFGLLLAWLSLTGLFNLMQTASDSKSGLKK